MTTTSLNSGILLAVLGTFFFSLKSIFIKLLYLEGLSVDQVLVFRMSIALPIYLMILFWAIRRQEQKISFNRRQIVLMIVAGFLGYYLSSLLDLMGLSLISAQLERLALFSYPFFVALLGAVFLKQALEPRLLIGLVISYSGLILLMLREGVDSNSNTGLGLGYVLLSALTFAIYLLLSKQLINQFGSLFFTSAAMTLSSLMVFIHGSLTIGIMSLSFSLEAWILLFLLAIFSTVIPSFLISSAIAKIGPTRTSAIGLLGPIFTILLAVVLLAESLSVISVLATVMVISGVAYATLTRTGR